MSNAMIYDYVAIPDAEIPKAAEPIFQHAVDTYVSEANKTVRHVACDPGRGCRLQAAREDEFDPHDPGASASLGTPLLRPVRRHAGACGRGTAAARREAGGGGVYRQIRNACPWPVAATGGGDVVVVARETAVLRRPGARADLGLLAARAAHVPSPDAGPVVAAARGAACADDLRPLRRRQMGRGGSDVFARRRETRRMEGLPR